jgi:porphobilinogen synthase
MVKKYKELSKITLGELIYPLFVKEGKGLRQKILSLPGVYKFSPDVLVKEVKYLKSLGLKQFLIFGVPKNKDWQGSFAYQDKNIVSESIRELKKNVRGITVMSDVCLCAYTSHGHCGIIAKRIAHSAKRIDNNKTLKALTRIALSHAQAGADFVAPSAMAQGQVKAIRDVLNKEGYTGVKILSYSAKFASNFYGPFRDIANSKPRFGNRRGYQLDYRDSQNALSRVGRDVGEGADIVMVKPALGYLDIVKQTKALFDYPLAVYNVSGEYALVKKGARLGFWDEKNMVDEIINSIKRAGADFIITYHAKDIARWQRIQ